MSEFAEMIVRGKVVRDTFVKLESLESLPERGDLLVTLSQFQSAQQALLSYRKAGAGQLGVLLAPTDDPQVLQAHFGQLDLIAVDFPKFADGRGFSIAWLLRRRLGWQGQLRAVGPLLRDQLFYLARVGFDAYCLRAGQDLHAALASLNDFSVRYQGSVDQAAPLFARHPAISNSPEPVHV
jgi:uncharacterized protein (DUF934 family)